MKSRPWEQDSCPHPELDFLGVLLPPKLVGLASEVILSGSAKVRVGGCGSPS